MRRLQGKGALITGGASGIGRATVELFLEEGAAVCVLDVDRDAGARIREELPALGGFVDADVRRRDQVEDAFRRAVEQIGDIDVVINNAGVSIRHGFLEITEQEWERVIGVNLTGAFHVAQVAARHMMDHRGGVIINTASTNALFAHAHYADYNASKAGLVSLTQSMALELAPRVRVNAVAPGYVLTPMQRREYSDEMLAAVNAGLPLGRHAEPVEIAELFVYLASDEAAYITGQVITIDGGESVAGTAGS